ncbi:MAG: methyltransferase domain-containing protein [Pyrinomonadaceae bacterium]
MNKWLMAHLVCPRDKKSLKFADNKLICPDGHSYPVVKDVPIMLVEDAEHTHGYINQTLEKVSTLNFENSENNASGDESNNQNGIDKFVQGEIPYTSGILYFSVQNKLSRYPIPEIRLPQGNGERLLDIGCNWGRWSIAAAKKNYKVIGIDPSLEAVFAAQRVSKQLGANADFVVGDARFLPFADDAFEVVFSYGVFQHLSKENVKISLDEAVRVLESGGKTLFQMPNKYGIRQYQQYRRRGYTEGEGFEIRYWTPAELMETFEKRFGAMQMTSDCYFGLGIQGKDADLLPLKYKIIVYTSEFLRKVSGVIKPLAKVADSVYLESVNQKKS